MDYPFEISTSANVSVIRLRTAALIACLDHGSVGSFRFTDEDMAPFLAKEGINPFTGKPQDSHWYRSHAFVNIPTDGNLALGEKKVLSELIASLKNKEFTPVHLRMSLDGEIDIYETWMELSDFSNWCEIRKIDLGDLYNEYSDDEDNILGAAIYSAEVARSRFETPDFDASFNIRVASEIKHNYVTVDQYRELLTENIVLQKAAAYPLERREEKPLQARERNTLLAIIAVLCKEAGLDYTKHAKAALIIKKTAETMGLTIGETTIEGKLKSIPNAVESRSR